LEGWGVKKTAVYADEDFREVVPIKITRRRLKPETIRPLGPFAFYPRSKKSETIILEGEKLATGVSAE